MKNIISKLALSTLALIIYTNPAHAAWTSLSVKDGANRLINRSTTCEYRMVTFSGWQYSPGLYTLNRTIFDFQNYKYNYQYSPSAYQSIDLSFNINEALANKIVDVASASGVVNLGGVYAGGSGNKAQLVSYLNEVRNNVTKFDCNLTVTVPPSGSTTPVAPFLTCTRRVTDTVVTNSYVLDPAYINIQENCN